MTRSEAIKAFFFKSVLPVTVALILYCIFKSACVKNGEVDYVWLWILCGLPFGLHRMCLWIVPGGGSLGGGIALFALNFIIGGVIGGFVLVWRLIVAVWYYGKLPLVPMEKPFTTCWKKTSLFPQACKQLSHSLAILTVYAHSHNAYCGGYPSFPIQS